MVFNFFLFGKKDDVVKRYTLKKIPLFAKLSDHELNSIAKIVRLVEFRKGDTIYNQGDPAEAFYVILSGRCCMYLTTAKNETRNLAFLHKHDYFGEVSLLTEKPHAGNVKVLNDSMILKIDKRDFFDLMQGIPWLSLQISRRLGVRVKKLYESESYQIDTKIVSILNNGMPHPALHFTYNLAGSLRRETNKGVLVLDLDCTDVDTLQAGITLQKLTETPFEQWKQYIKSHAAGFDHLVIDHRQAGVNTKELVNQLTSVLTHYNYILIALPDWFDEVCLTIIEQSDLVYVSSAADREALGTCQRLIDRLRTQSHVMSTEIRLVLYKHEQKRTLNVKQTERLMGVRIFSIVPCYFDTKKFEDEQNKQQLIVISEPTSPFARSLRFLARELGGVLVGLALGSGAAFGLAHIGVLKILERENIPVDIISGSSIGAVIGAFWASGYTADEVEKVALSLQHKRNLVKLIDIFDVSAPHFGFFKGRTVHRFMSKYLGKKTFEDLQIPLRIVATDLVTSEDVIFKEGYVVDAVRASISIPGIVKPYPVKKKNLIDGGVTNPLPINVLTEEGVRKVIAVNVLPDTRDVLDNYQYYQEQITARYTAMKKSFFIKKVLFHLSQWIRRHYEGNIFNVLMNTVQYLEAAVASMQQSDADIIIHPILCGSHWAQFYDPQKFIQCGEAKTDEAIEEIKRLIND